MAHVDLPTPKDAVQTYPLTEQPQCCAAVSTGVDVKFLERIPPKFDFRLPGELTRN